MDYVAQIDTRNEDVQEIIEAVLEANPGARVKQMLALCYETEHRENDGVKYAAHFHHVTVIFDGGPDFTWPPK